MPVNDSGLRDDIRVELNGAPVGSRSSLPERPAADAPDTAWVDYAVALGADRGRITGGSRHYDAEAGGYVTAEALTREQLVALATSLGG